jgi:hypothetical protein
MESLVPAGSDAPAELEVVLDPESTFKSATVWTLTGLEGGTPPLLFCAARLAAISNMNSMVRILRINSGHPIIFDLFFSSLEINSHTATGLPFGTGGESVSKYDNTETGAFATRFQLRPVCCDHIVMKKKAARG